MKRAGESRKYFDGLRPIFGNSMITIDGALWQKIRMPQQPAFTPKMFGERSARSALLGAGQVEGVAALRRDRRDHQHAGGDLGSGRQHDLQGAVRPRGAVQPAGDLPGGEDLYRCRQPPLDPLQEGQWRGACLPRGSCGRCDFEMAVGALDGARRGGDRRARDDAPVDDARAVADESNTAFTEAQIVDELSNICGPAPRPRR